MNTLIVESKNDKEFIEALLEDIHLENTTVDAPSCAIDDYSCMNGLNKKKLVEHLKEKIDEIQKLTIQKIGVLIDQDQETKAARLAFVSEAATEAFGVQVVLDDINSFKTIYLDEDTSFELICHFTNIDEQGELETVLKKIATKEAIYADCLETWKSCIETKGKSISQKEFDKFWISNYIRFDTCSKNDKTQADRKCSMQNFDYVLKNKDIFNLKATELTNLRAFLNLFK